MLLSILGFPVDRHPREYVNQVYNAVSIGPSPVDRRLESVPGRVLDSL